MPDLVEMSAPSSGGPRDPRGSLVADNDNHPLTLAELDLRLIILCIERRREALGGWADCAEAVALRDLLRRLSPVPTND